MSDCEFFSLLFKTSLFLLLTAGLWFDKGEEPGPPRSLEHTVLTRACPVVLVSCFFLLCLRVSNGD